MQNKKTIQINQRIPTSLYLCIALKIILELEKTAKNIISMVIIGSYLIFSIDL